MPMSHYVDPPGLELVAIFLPRPSKLWHYRLEPPCHTYSFIQNFKERDLEAGKWLGDQECLFLQRA